MVGDRNLTPVPEMRRCDFTLDETDADIVAMVERFFDQECNGRRGRVDIADAFDPHLWAKFSQLGIVEMAALPAELDGAGTVLLALVCEQVGRVLAPIPVIETLVVARTLGRSGAEGAQAHIAALAAGTTLAAMIPRPLGEMDSQLVSAGATASTFLVMDGGVLKLVEADRLPSVRVYGVGGFGRWIGSRDLPGLVLAQGDRAAQLFAEANRLLETLLAAAMAGLAAEATMMGAEFSGTRQTKGVPIGSLQAISFPLTQSWILANAARNLTRKAAWFEDFEPGARPDLADLAAVAAARAAQHACITATHVQGGFGFDSTSDISCYNRVARIWASQIDAPERDVLPRLGDLLIGMPAPAANQRGFI